MVAVDDATEENGCLQAPGKWSKKSNVPLHQLASSTKMLKLRWTLFLSHVTLVIFSSSMATFHIVPMLI
jgi:hypothetical protein